MGHYHSMIFPQSKSSLTRPLIVHPRLAYCSTIWRQWIIKNIVLVERIQCKRTKYIFSDYQLGYKTELVSLHLPTAEVHICSKNKTVSCFGKIIFYLRFIAGTNIFLVVLPSLLVYFTNYF